MATSATVDCSVEIANWARWGVAHKAWFFYDEERPFPLYQPSAARPIYNDCSATVTLWYWLAGASDPNGLHYANPEGRGYYGDTGTLQVGQQITQAEARAADVVIYGPGYGVHCALVIDNNDGNPLTVSHGQPSEPAFVTVSNGQPEGTDGVVRFFRFNTTKPAPVPPKPPAPPAPEEDMEFLAQSWNGSATLLYTVSTHTARGVSATEAPFLKGKITAYTSAQASQAMRAEYTREGVEGDVGFISFGEFAPELHKA